VLPEPLAADLDSARWPRPPIFDWLQRAGGIEAAEMHRVFNCGIGLAVVVAPGDVGAALSVLAARGERAWHVGTIVERSADAPSVRVA
jgi:phosphoribosylformylglycinamidine cyclo-ligase